jgi:hypothetical protein
MIPHPKLLRKTSTGATWSEVLQHITGGHTVTASHLIDGPGFVYRPIPESTTQPTIKPRNIILHTNAGQKSAASLWAWITRASVNGEPHFQIGFNIAEQYMPMNRRADCNYSANSWLAGGITYGAVSFETQDLGAATVNSTPWTARQLQLIIAAITCICVTYGVHCSAPATWDSSGIGHHSLFPFQGPLRKAWTNVAGKICPGRARIAQMDYIRTKVTENLAEFVRQTGWECGT